MAQVQDLAAEPHVSGAGSDLQGDPSPAKKSRKASSLPPTAPMVTDEAFYAYVAALKPDDWPRVAIYCYRHVPRIIRDPSNIHIVDGEAPAVPFDKSFVLREFGSGKYNFKLNDKTTGYTVCQCSPDYNFPDKPPIFDIRELDTEWKGNRLLVEKLKREGKLSLDGTVVAAPATNGDGLAQALKEVALKAMEQKGGNQPGAQDLAYQKSLGMIADASSESLKVVMERLKTEGKGSDLAAIMPLLIAMVTSKNATPVAAPDNTVLTILMQMLSAAEKRAEAADARASEERKEAGAERQRQHELQLKAMEQKATAADPMDMVEKVLNIQEKLGGGQQDSRNWKEKLVDQGFEALPDLINLGKAAIGSYKRDPQPQQRPQQQQPTQQNRPTPQNVPAVEVQPVVTGESNVPEQPKLDPDVEWLANYLSAHGGLVVNFFRNNPNGHAFADSFILFTNEAVFQKIQLIGKIKILQAIQLLPGMLVDLVGNPPSPAAAQSLERFIDEFVAGPEDDDEDDEPDEFPEAARQSAPAAPKRGKKAATA